MTQKAQCFKIKDSKSVTTLLTLHSCWITQISTMKPSSSVLTNLNIFNQSQSSMDFISVSLRDESKEDVWIINSCTSRKPHALASWLLVTQIGQIGLLDCDRQKVRPITFQVFPPLVNVASKRVLRALHQMICEMLQRQKQGFHCK